MRLTYRLRHEPLFPIVNMLADVVDQTPGDRLGYPDVVWPLMDVDASL